MLKALELDLNGVNPRSMESVRTEPYEEECISTLKKDHILENWGWILPAMGTQKRLEDC